MIHLNIFSCWNPRDDREVLQVIEKDLRPDDLVSIVTKDLVLVL